MMSLLGQEPDSGPTTVSIVPVLKFLSGGVIRVRIVTTFHIAIYVPPFGGIYVFMFILLKWKEISSALCVSTEAWRRFDYLALFHGGCFHGHS